MSAENSPSDPSVTPPVAQPAPPVVLPPENVTRGLLFALIALPLGVILFVIIWNLGYVASIVGFAIAFAAFFLYKKGSGGRISIRGALLVGGVTLVTLAIAFIIAETMDLASVGFTWAQAASIPGFGSRSSRRRRHDRALRPDRVRRCGDRRGPRGQGSRRDAGRPAGQPARTVTLTQRGARRGCA